MLQQHPLLQMTLMSSTHLALKLIILYQLEGNLALFYQMIHMETVQQLHMLLQYRMNVI